MSEHDTPRIEPAPSPHPLARALAAALAGDATARLLIVGIGNGRNVPVFTAARIHVDAVEEDAERARAAAERFAGVADVRVEHASHAGPYPWPGTYAGALSTNGLLHGTATDVARTLGAIRERLRPGTPCYATFGSERDPRFGAGRRIDDATWAPATGSEAGVPHAYFDRLRLERVLDGFAIDEAVEGSAAQTVGRWAHDADDAAGIVHWFVKARRA